MRYSVLPQHKNGYNYMVLHIESLEYITHLCNHNGMFRNDTINCLWCNQYRCSTDISILMVHCCVIVITDVYITVEYLRKSGLQFTKEHNGFNSKSFQEQKSKVLLLEMKIYQ